MAGGVPLGSHSRGRAAWRSVPAPAPQTLHNCVHKAGLPRHPLPLACTPSCFRSEGRPGLCKSSRLCRFLSVLWPPCRRQSGPSLTGSPPDPASSLPSPPGAVAPLAPPAVVALLPAGARVRSGPSLSAGSRSGWRTGAPSTVGAQPRAPSVLVLPCFSGAACAPLALSHPPELKAALTASQTETCAGSSPRRRLPAFCAAVLVDFAFT